MPLDILLAKITPITHHKNLVEASMDTNTAVILFTSFIAYETSTVKTSTIQRLVRESRRAGTYNRRQCGAHHASQGKWRQVDAEVGEQGGADGGGAAAHLRLPADTRAVVMPHRKALAPVHVRRSAAIWLCTGLPKMYENVWIHSPKKLLYALCKEPMRVGCGFLTVAETSR